MHQLWQNVRAGEYLRLVKALQQWCASSKIYALLILQQYQLQGSSTCHSVLASWNFGPQHCSPTWIALPTWVLLDSWRIKSQGCQKSVWESLSSCAPLCKVQQCEKGRIFKSSWWDLLTVLVSRSHFPAWQTELSCMSQAQQSWWAYCLLHVLCKRMKHCCLNHVCLLEAILLVEIAVNQYASCEMLQ